MTTPNLLSKSLFRIALAALLYLPLSTQAMLITDVVGSDLNTIDFSFNQTQATTTLETYQENHVVANYITGYDALVHDNAGSPQFFDKLIDASGDSGTWGFQFNVDNQTGAGWTAYRFEFYDATFTSTLSGAFITNVVLQVPTGSTQSTLNPATAMFAFDGPFSSGTMQGNISLDLSLLPTTFGVRQIALLDAFDGSSSVPLPPSGLLLMLGLPLFYSLRVRR